MRRGRKTGNGKRWKMEERKPRQLKEKRFKFLKSEKVSVRVREGDVW